MTTLRQAAATYAKASGRRKNPSRDPEPTLVTIFDSDNNKLVTMYDGPQTFTEVRFHSSKFISGSAVEG